MRNSLKSVAFIISSILVAYSVFSVAFVEYLVFSDRILGYYGSDTMRPPQLYVNADDGRRVALYSPENGASYGSGIQIEFSDKFLFSLDPRASKEGYFFKYLPSGKPIMDKPLLLKIRSNKRFEDIGSYHSAFSGTISDMTSRFGSPKNFRTFLGSVYYWRKGDELMEIVGNDKNLLTIWLSDARIMDNYGGITTLIPKKRSPLLLISRLGFFKKVWYSSE